MCETKVNYDSDHDILYVYLTEPQMGYEEEIYPNVFVRRADSTDEVIGFIIMDFTRNNQSIIQKFLPPEVNVESLKKEYVH